MAMVASPGDLSLHTRIEKHSLQLQRRNKSPVRQRIQKYSKCSLDNIAFLQSHFECELRNRKEWDSRSKTWPRSGRFPPLVLKPQEKTLTQIRLKNITNRIPSATGLVITPETTCDRQEQMNDSQLRRHFCELLGPTLCCDCSEKRNRVVGIKECEEIPALDQLEHDPFTAFIATHYSKDGEFLAEDSDEEILVNEFSDNDEEWTEERGISSRGRSAVTVNRYTLSPSPPPGDSGYSSRASYIRSLTRAQSSRLFRSIPSTPVSPMRRERTASRLRELKIRFKSGSKEHSKEMEKSNALYSIDSTIAETLGRLEERTEFMNSQGTCGKPSETLSSIKTWSSQVGPVLMELKLINFTQYDKLGYGPSDIAIPVEQRLDQ